MIRLDDAERFIWAAARLIERRRYAYHFRGGETEPVLVALRPYQNPDGGFGNALEPDLRGPDSQPLAVAAALSILDEVDAFDDPLVRTVCDYLTSASTLDGGLPFMWPSGRAFPRAPWCDTPADPPASLLPTATIAALLHAHAVQHQWLQTATDYCWRALDDWAADEAYSARAALLFLEHVPDRERARAAFERVGAALLEHKLVELDPAAPGEVHTPLDFAPRPDSLGRELFTDAVIEAHLDALEAAQQDDGGWLVNWQIWTPATGPEWRGWATLHALLTLRAYGRLS